MPVTVGPSTPTINHDRQFLISQPNATMVLLVFFFQRYIIKSVATTGGK